jgi:hypothetical protein
MPIYPMLQFPFAESWPEEKFAALRQIAERAESMRLARGNRAANQYLIDDVGLTLLSEVGDPFYREALDYHLGLIYAFLDQPANAARHFDASRTLPGSGGDLVYSEQVAQSLDIRNAQTAAATRGMPPILLASMPRSASASLTQTLASTLGIALLRVSAGRFPHYSLVPSWLNHFFFGGAVTHDHFSASPFNLDLLKLASANRVFVLARDPRASAASVLNLTMKRTGASVTNQKSSARFMEHVLRHFVPWLDQWMMVAQDAKSPVAVHLLSSDEVRRDVGGVVRRILTILLPEYPSVTPYLEGQVNPVRANFVQGNDDAWRSLVDDRQRAQLWEAMPQNIRDWLDLKP